MFDWRRIGWRWYGLIFRLYPTAVLLAFLINGRPPDFSPLQALLREPAYLAATLIFVFIFGPFSEELGWRGCVLDWLQARYSAFIASTILGVIWWAWHLPLLLAPGSFLQLSGGDPVFLAGYLGTVSPGCCVVKTDMSE
ncbi:MAG: CPBP family intramembrane metalloprotease [Chloroflexi bacterium]|nr:CPBP family intramembrane metalloprotease [Chloroflexota bacterium]